MQFRRDDGCGRIRAHAAGVGPLVIVLQPLVVLAGGERQDVLAIHHHDEAGLFAFKKFFDDNTSTGIAQFVV